MCPYHQACADIEAQHGSSGTRATQLHQHACSCDDTQPSLQFTWNSAATSVTLIIDRGVQLMELFIAALDFRRGCAPRLAASCIWYKSCGLLISDAVIWAKWGAEGEGTKMPTHTKNEANTEVLICSRRLGPEMLRCSSDWGWHGDVDRSQEMDGENDRILVYEKLSALSTRPWSCLPWSLQSKPRVHLLLWCLSSSLPLLDHSAMQAWFGLVNSTNKISQRVENFQGPCSLGSPAYVASHGCCRRVTRLYVVEAIWYQERRVSTSDVCGPQKSDQNKFPCFLNCADPNSSAGSLNGCESASKRRTCKILSEF